MAWRARLAPTMSRAGLDPAAPDSRLAAGRRSIPFCEIVETYRPEVVSFHFGAAGRGLIQRVRATGAKIISSATTVAEAQRLAERGVDAVIAMGFEAGGHRGNFLTQRYGDAVGTAALVPQIADAVAVPAIAAGGIARTDADCGSFRTGAAAAQIGTSYLFTPEAKIPPVHRAALERAGATTTRH